MSEHVDARFLREMVRELVSEEPRPIDWEHAEERLFARLDEVEASGEMDECLPLSGDLAADAEEDEHGLYAHGFVGRTIEESATGETAMIDRSAIDASGIDESVGQRISESSLVAIDFEDTGVARIRELSSSSGLLGERARRDAGVEPGDRSSSSAYVTAIPVSSRLDERAMGRHPVLLHVPALGNRFDDVTPIANDAGIAKSAHGAPGGGFARRWSMVAAIAAVAACVAFVLGGLLTGGLSSKLRSGDGQANRGDVPEITAERWVDPADVPMVPGMSGTHDLSALRSGDMVEALAGAVSFAQADKVSWTLSPGSRVFVRSGIDSPRHVLILESGSIRAQVLQGPTAGLVDSFVVEAGETRVAVGGTIFSVTRSTKGIVVDVEYGFVVVGPRDELGVGSGRLLHESERGSFSLDGGRSYKPLSQERTAVIAPDRGLHTASVATVPGGVAPDGALSELSTDGAATSPAIRDDARRKGAPVDIAQLGTGPLSQAPTDPLMNEGTIRASLDRCFARVEAQRRETSKDDSVSVTMRSTLRLRVTDDGAIKGASFSPPLRPDPQSCAVSLLSAHVERGARTLDIPVEIRH